MTVAEQAPRSLTQMLREADDDLLAELMVARPDLVTPPPTSFSQVASRATTRDSVRRVLDQLTMLELWVAQQANAHGCGVSAADVAGVDAVVADRVLNRLRRLGLLWGDPNALRPVRALGQELDRSPVREPPEPGPPLLAELRRDPQQVDSVAAGSAFELVRRTEVLIEHADHVPIPVRADHGLAQRELRQLAGLLDVPSAVALLHIEIARAAGLLGLAGTGRHDALLPTRDFDDWQGSSLGEQWRRLRDGWHEGHPPSGSSAVKAICFAAFGPPGDARAVGAPDLLRWLGWQRPRLVDAYRRTVSTLLTQAPWVGVTGLGALASFWDGAHLAELDRLLPRRADSIVVQNDLTAVAPAPLTPEAARELGALADVESRGGATVYRFTVASLHRAHSMGWTPSEMTTTLLTRSRTPIPQPLTYLIGDLERGARQPGTATPVAGDPAPHSARHPTGRRGQPAPMVPKHEEPVLSVRAARAMVRRLRDDLHDTPRTRHQPAAAETRPDAFETLREAVETGEVVWVGSVDAAGATTERLLFVDAAEEGLLVGRDSRSGERLQIPMHRVTIAHIIRGGSV